MRGEPGNKFDSEATRSVCPTCLKTIAARREERGDAVVLVKECPEHGRFETPVWRGLPAYKDWKKPKSPSTPQRSFTETRLGCPHDCGLCPRHGQHTCTALLEVTLRCNLACPVCFASAGGNDASKDPDSVTVGFWYDRIKEASGLCNIQLSGGEPTMRDDLPDIVALGRSKGFSFIQLNTNGLRLAEDHNYGEALREAGLASVFLQFDAMDDDAYRIIRGRPLLELKTACVERCLELGFGVILVPTIVPGVNEYAVGDIIRFALQAGIGVRGVHMQPMSRFGRHPGSADDERLTLPELIRLVEKHMEGLVRLSDFAPPGCEHALCSFHATYVRTPAGGLEYMGNNDCCGPESKPSPAEEGARRTRERTSRQWSAPVAEDCGSLKGDFDIFLERAKATFTLSAMAFQDARTLDLERLQGCCIHVVSPDGRLVPFCSWNLTADDGTPLHRGRHKVTA